jgi:hypothetical protein
MAAKTKDELLVDNAILRYNDQVRKMLKEELSPLNTKITGLEERVDGLEGRVKEVEQIIEPFGIIRRRFWFLVIAVTLTVSVAGSKIADYIGNLTR